MLAEVGTDHLHAQGETAEPAGDLLGCVALRVREGAMFFQQAQRVLEGQFAEREPMDVVSCARSHRRAEAGGGQQVKLWAEDADQVGLLRCEQGEVGDVVQDEKNTAQLSEPLPQRLAKGAEVKVERLALLVAGGA